MPAACVRRQGRSASAPGSIHALRAEISGCAVGCVDSLRGGRGLGALRTDQSDPYACPMPAHWPAPIISVKRCFIRSR